MAVGLKDMMNNRWINVMISVALIVFSVYLYREAIEFPMGSDLFPKFLLIVIIGLAGLMLIDNLLLKKESTDFSLKESNIRDVLRPYASFICIAGYIVLMLLFGFFPATIVTGVILFPVLDVARKKIYVSIVLSTILFVYVLFVYFLGVPFPKGSVFE